MNIKANIEFVQYQCSSEVWTDFVQNKMSSFRCTSILFLVITISVISEFKTLYDVKRKIDTASHRAIPKIRFQPGNNGQFQWSDNCDYWANNIDTAVVSKEKCGEICFQRKECTHFTWNGVTCCLKNLGPGYVEPSLFVGAVCGYVLRPLLMSWTTGVNKRIIWSSDCDFVALDIQDIASSKDDCMNHCANNSRCTHFTFTYVNTAAICRLKQTDMRSITATLKENVFCGYVSKLLKQYDGNNNNNTTLYWNSGKDYFTAWKSNKTLE